MERKIIKCRITEQPKDLFDPIPDVWILLEGETEEQFLFSYYPDEITFTEKEFTGKTIMESHSLKFEKDKRYLLS